MATAAAVCALVLFLAPLQVRCLGWAPAPELVRVRIVNDAGGAIAASYDCGQTWHHVGSVVRYTTRVSNRGYTASKWVAPGRVAATAVNAVHIGLGVNEEEDRGIIFSILPRDFLAPPGSYNSFLSPDSSLYTDIPAGHGIFGGGLAPFVGNLVYCETDQSERVPLTEGYMPRRGDVLNIVVTLPAPYPVAAEIENAEGGTVALCYPDGSKRLVGWVIRPVRGIGRFAGSLYAGIGRVRANHAGVVDVSTSPVRALGAFQMIPVAHAMSPEMHFAWTKTQWMIVGPIEDESFLWGTLTPLFYQHIRPDYLTDDLCATEWRTRLLARFVVEVDTGDGWRPMPSLRLSSDPAAPLPAWANNALDEVDRIRILFPILQAADPSDMRGGRSANAKPPLSE